MDFIKWRFLTLYLFFVFFSLSTGFAAPPGRPAVNTTAGGVIGWFVESKTTAGRYMRVFKGIPYAKPPLKELRFLEPFPADSWTEARNLSQDDPMACPQPPSLGIVNYSEDCLFVNVYTPEAVDASSLLPVMVWIHGGGFLVGSSYSTRYGPDFLVDEDVVFVSLNYRLGALGFLNLGTDKVPGNAGLKDQLLALEWVQKEIANFGGDPTKVTLFGESAGSVSVMLLYLVPRSANLFSYAIAESGTALCQWGFQETGYLDNARNFSSSLNCLPSGTVQLSCLQNASVESIVVYQNLNTSLQAAVNGLGLAFVPSLEKPSATALLSDTPSNLLTQLLTTSNSRRPIITGTNKDEGVLILKLDPKFYTGFYANLQYLIPEVYRSRQSVSQIQDNIALIKTEYFNNTPPSLTNLNGFIKIFTDVLFGVGVAAFARKMNNAGLVYLYEFDFYGDFNANYSILTELNITNAVSHADELGYIFLRSGLNQTNAAENSTSMITLRRLVKFWTNFAKYGNPTPDGTTDNVLGNVLWSPIVDGHYQYMRVTERLEMATDSYKERAFNFWNKIEGISSGTNVSYSLALLLTVIVLSNLSYFYLNN